MKTKQTSAFTVIEMLIALGIFSVIALGLYSVFWNAVQINQRSKILNNIYREARWSTERLVKDLENSVIYNFGSGYPKEKTFASEEDKITFIISGKEGLKVVQYYLDTSNFGNIFKTEVGETVSKMKTVKIGNQNTENTSFLIRQEQSIIDYLQFNPEDNSEKEVLSIHFKNKGLKFWFAYRERNEGAGKIVWNEEWNENYPPYGVRTEMTFFTGLKGEEEIVLTRDIFIPAGDWGESKIEFGF